MKMASVGEPPHPAKRQHNMTIKMQEYVKSQSDVYPQRLFKCPKEGCGKVYTSNPGLRYHKKTHHCSTHSEFICMNCKKKFKSHNGLKYHTTKKRCEYEDPVHVVDEYEPSSPMEILNKVTRSSLPIHTTGVDTCKTSLPMHCPHCPTSVMNNTHTEYIGREEERIFPTRPVYIECNQEKKEQSADDRLLDFAKIATSPQSPLMQKTCPFPWGQDSGQVVRSLSEKFTECEKLSRITESSSIPMEGPAVQVLSDMAMQRKKNSPVKKEGSPTKKKQKPDQDVAAKRPMNSFFLFAKLNRENLQIQNPGTDNRTISKMLGEIWKNFSEEEKRRYEEEARLKADEQKKNYPNCWKRKR